MIATLPMLVVSCSGDDSHKSLGDGWTIEGTLKGGADKTVYVEASKTADWYVLDSLVVDDKDTFSFQAAEADTVPTVYRLRVGSQYIYFPVTGGETVTYTGDAARFDRGYKLSGSVAANGFGCVDSLINEAVDRLGAPGALKDSTLKVNLNRIINRDSTCIVSYYIIGKFIDGKPYYDLTSSRDVAMLGNAANNWTRMRPNDPRTQELTARYTTAKQLVRRSDPNRKVREIAVGDDQILSRPQVEMKLYDRAGKLHDFDKVATPGHVTVLNISLYSHKDSPANVTALKKLYEKYGKSGVSIYQVSMDDEMFFKEASANLPWTAVWANPAQARAIMIGYNANPVDGGPVSFIFNKQGELISRVSDPSKLESVISPLL